MARGVKVPTWELAVYRIAPPICLVSLALAASVGVDVDPILFGIAAVAHWKMAVGLLKFPESWVSQIPTPAIPAETKRIDDQMA